MLRLGRNNVLLWWWFRHQGCTLVIRFGPAEEQVFSADSCRYRVVDQSKWAEKQTLGLQTPALWRNDRLKSTSLVREDTQLPHTPPCCAFFTSRLRTWLREAEIYIPAVPSSSGRYQA